jgi:hypothetical protein
MRNAKELRKEMSVSKQYLNKVTSQIERFKNKGRACITAGVYSCTQAELMLAIEELEKNGYEWYFSRNSHGVRTLVVEW